MYGAVALTRYGRHGHGQNEWLSRRGRRLEVESRVDREKMWRKHPASVRGQHYDPFDFPITTSRPLTLMTQNTEIPVE